LTIEDEIKGAKDLGHRPLNFQPAARADSRYSLNNMCHSFFSDRVCSGGLQHALNVVATQQAEHDSRLLEHLRGEMLQQSAGCSQSPLQQAPNDHRFLKSNERPVDRFFDVLNPAITEIAGTLPFALRGTTAVQTDLARYANVTMPLATSPNVKHAIAGHAGLHQVGPTQLLRTVIGNEKRDPRLENRSDRQNTNDPIEQVAPGYTTLLNNQNRIAVLEHASATSRDEFTRTLADKQTLDQIRLRAETNGDERQLLADVFQDRGKNRDIRSLHVPHQGPFAEGIISSELALDRAADAPVLGSITANFGALIAQGNKRTISANTPTNFDRDGGYKFDGGPFANPATNHSVQDALAAATEEVERLTAAVTRTIHELERARGSVQPALPALPLNFGSFRLS
jgi:hypothetical protein